jgi:hypothetical protein
MNRFAHAARSGEEEGTQLTWNERDRCRGAGAMASSRRTRYLQRFSRSAKAADTDGEAWRCSQQRRHARLVSAGAARRVPSATFMQAARRPRSSAPSRNVAFRRCRRDSGMPHVIEKTEGRRALIGVEYLLPAVPAPRSATQRSRDEGTCRSSAPGEAQQVYGESEHGQGGERVAAARPAQASYATPDTSPITSHLTHITPIIRSRQPGCFIYSCAQAGQAELLRRRMSPISPAVRRRELSRLIWLDIRRQLPLARLLDAGREKCAAASAIDARSRLSG